jgi:hypothetical protein
LITDASPKHLEAVDLQKKEAAQIAEYEAAEEQRNFGQFDRYDF